VKQEIILSVALHATIILATAVSSPFDIKKRDYDSVIKVRAISASELPSFRAEPEPVPTVDVPQAVEAEQTDIPLDDPTTKPPEKIDKPKPKPKPKKEPAPQETTPAATEQSAQSGSEIETSSTSQGNVFSGATVDDASFDYPSWFDQAFYKIRSNWRNPVSADFDIVCVVKFFVLRSGRIVDEEVVESSGVANFDDACLAALTRSSPFPPLPPEFRDEIIGITLPFKYEPQ
jgi:protein TonB